MYQKLSIGKYFIYVCIRNTIRITNIIIMDTVKAEKIQKTSWTDTVRGMEVGSVLECTLKERLAAAARISEYKRQNPEVEFSRWMETGDDKYIITRLK